MNVLIADDEPMTRSLLRRVLTRECGCTVIEAADGLAALSSCGTTPPDLILTDLRMPVMDGIALIEALRQVPALAAIPVVMMTAARDQGPVHRAIELGVTDYLLKPLQADRVADRLRSVVERVRASDASAVEDRTPLLVADGKADFRQLVAAALGPLRVVHQAQSGVAALQRAVETRPGVILVGGDLGLLGPDLLMRKLRAAGELAGTRIVAVVERGSEAVIPEPADAVLIRTSSADVLRAQLSKITGRGAAAGAIAADAALRSQLAAVAEQELRALLQLDMQHTSEIQPRPVPRMIVASKGIALPDRAASILTLRTDLPSAAKIAAGMPRDGATPVPDEDAALVAVAHVLDAVAGRLAHSDAAGGDTATRPAPSCQLTGAGDLSAGAEGRVQVTVYTADGVAQLVLQLTAAGAAAGPLPAEAKAAPVAAS